MAKPRLLRRTVVIQARCEVDLVRMSGDWLAVEIRGPTSTEAFRLAGRKVKARIEGWAL